MIRHPEPRPWRKYEPRGFAVWLQHGVIGLVWIVCAALIAGIAYVMLPRYLGHILELF